MGFESIHATGGRPRGFPYLKQNQLNWRNRRLLEKLSLFAKIKKNSAPLPLLFQFMFHKKKRLSTGKALLSSLMQFFTRWNLCSINYQNHLDLVVEAGVKEVVKQSHWNFCLMELCKVCDSAPTSRWNLSKRVFPFDFHLSEVKQWKIPWLVGAYVNGLLMPALRDFTSDWIRRGFGLKTWSCLIRKVCCC